MVFDITNLHGVTGGAGKALLADGKADGRAGFIMGNHQKFQRLGAVVKVVIMQADLAVGSILIQQAGGVYLLGAVAVDEGDAAKRKFVGRRLGQLSEIFIVHIQVQLAAVQVIKTVLGFGGQHLVAYLKNQLGGFAPLAKGILQTQAHGILTRCKKGRRAAGFGLQIALFILPGVSVGGGSNFLPVLIGKFMADVQRLADVHPGFGRVKLGDLRRQILGQIIFGGYLLTPQAVGVFYAVVNGVIAALPLIKQPVQAGAGFGHAIRVDNLPFTLGQLIARGVKALVGKLNFLTRGGRQISDLGHGRLNRQNLRQGDGDTFVGGNILNLAVHQLGQQAKRHQSAVIHHHWLNAHLVWLAVGVKFAVG